MDNYIQDNEIQIEIPKNLLSPDFMGTVEKIIMYFEASELEQVKKALPHGKNILTAALNRTKAFHKRAASNININNINSVIHKVENCKPKKVYPITLLTSEAESLIYCLEHSKGSKSKEMQKLIAALKYTLE